MEERFSAQQQEIWKGFLDHLALFALRAQSALEMAKELSMKSKPLVLMVGAMAAVIAGIAVLGRSAEPPLPVNARADSVLIDKTGHTMTLFSGGQTLRTYVVSLGRGAWRRRRGKGITGRRRAITGSMRGTRAAPSIFLCTSAILTLETLRPPRRAVTNRVATS